MFSNRCEPIGGGGGRGGGREGRSVILVRHNLSIIPPAEHNSEHYTLVSRVMLESVMLYFLSIIRKTRTNTTTVSSALFSVVTVTVVIERKIRPDGPKNQSD